MDLIFAFGAGLLTLINPCVLPVLPFILGAAVQDERMGPLALAAGLSTSFVVLGVAVASLGPAIGLDADTVARIGAFAMIGFGLVLLIPALNERFAAAAAGLANQAIERRGAMEGNGLWGQFLGGALLGAAWSPCIGPTLGGAISLASQGKSIAWATAIMTAFALGASTIILALAYGTREALMRRKAQLAKFATQSKPILAGALILVGLAMAFGLHQRIEGWATQFLPVWLQELSVSL